MTKLSTEQWELIMLRIQTADNEIHEEFGESVEIIWLDSTDEWALVYAYDIFEDGFKSEEEARERLKEIEKELE